MAVGNTKYYKNNNGGYVALEDTGNDSGLIQGGYRSFNSKQEAISAIQSEIQAQKELMNSGNIVKDADGRWYFLNKRPDGSVMGTGVYQGPDPERTIKSLQDSLSKFQSNQGIYADNYTTGAQMVDGKYWTAESLAQKKQYEDAVARGEMKVAQIVNGVPIYVSTSPTGLAETRPTQAGTGIVQQGTQGQQVGGTLNYSIPNASGKTASAGQPDAGTYQSRSLPIGPQSSMPPTSNLTPGMSGEAVKQLQQYLVSKGYMTQAEMDTGPGVYGPRTTSAVAKMQAALGVDNSSGPGYYGPKTIAAVSGGGQASTPSTPSTVSEVEKYINGVVEAVVASGKTINPDLTAEDLAAIDPARFLQQAEASIAPEYAGKFAEIKDSLTRTLSNLGYDLNLKKQEIQRESKSTLETGEEELAGRGLAFSGKRQQFNQDLQDETTRSLTAADVAAGRDVQSKITEAEGKIGTEQVRNLGFGNPTSQPIQYNSAPLIGSLTSEKSYLKESMAKELARQEAERRAYTTRSLSFS